MILFVAGMAFLLGSFPTGVVLTRLLTGRDIRRSGSGNIGAANAARAGGMKLGVSVAVADILKGSIPVLIASGLGIHGWGLALVAFAAVFGHDFSVFIQFRGGKGVATTVGVALILAPGVALVAIVVWGGVVLLTRYSSLGSLLALTVLPIAAAISGAPQSVVWLFLALAILGLAKHWENVFRLMHGTEGKFTRPRDGS